MKGGAVATAAELAGAVASPHVDALVVDIRSAEEREEGPTVSEERTSERATDIRIMRRSRQTAEENRIPPLCCSGPGSDLISLV